MKFDLGEVLGRTWRIGWNHKTLWLWQMLPNVAIVFLLPIFVIFAPIVTILVNDPDKKIPVEPWISIANSSFLLFGVSYILLRLMAQITTVHGVIRIEKAGELSLSRELFQKSLIYFWRVFGLYGVYYGTGVLLMLILALPLIINPASVHDPSRIYFRLPSLLFSPILLIGACVLELAQASIITDDLRMLPAISNGWKLFKANILNVSIMMIVLYFGMNILLGLFLIPFMFLAPISILSLTRMPDSNLIIFIFLFIVIPLAVVLPTSFFGILMTFFQSAWAVTYLRLSNNTKENSKDAEL